MRTGQLNHFLTIQREHSTRATDGSGDRIKSWQKEFDVWGDIDALSGRDYIAAKSQQTMISHRIGIRCSDIPPGFAWPGCRIESEGVIYKINAALPDNQNGKQWITLMCESGSAVWA